MVIMPSVRLLDTRSPLIKDLPTESTPRFEHAEVKTWKGHGSSENFYEGQNCGGNNPKDMNNMLEDFSLQNNNLELSLNINTSLESCSGNMNNTQGSVSGFRNVDGTVEMSRNEPLSTKHSDPSKLSNNNGHNEKFVCHYCDAEFRIRGYLTRHIKKHAVEKAYYCPFFNTTLPPETRCHTTGGFSRRDTYKTHIRSRHFIYPEGIKAQARNKSSGHCSHCGQWFENTDVWIENHIETRDCSGLPDGTTICVKNSRKSGKLKVIKTSTGYSRFISTQRSVVEPKVLLNKDAIEVMQIVVKESDSSNHPALTKMSDNRIMLDSKNYKGDSKQKKRYISKKKNVYKLNNDKRLPSPQQFITPEETPLHDICFSINQSPTEDSSLESVKSISSLSSHDYYHETESIGPNVSFPIPSNRNISYPYLVPLDLEQGGFDLNTYFSNNSENNQGDKPSTQGSQINITLSNHLDTARLIERQFRENEQYKKFYNYTFGSAL